MGSTAGLPTDSAENLRCVFIAALYKALTVRYIPLTIPIAHLFQMFFYRFTIFFTVLAVRIVILSFTSALAVFDHQFVF